MCSMRRRAFVILAGLLAITSRADAQSTAVATGTIESVSMADSSLVVRTSSGTRTGRFTPRTLITIGGMPGELRDLRPGQSVTIQFAVTGRGQPSLELVRIDVQLAHTTTRSSR